MPGEPITRDDLARMAARALEPLSKIADEWGDDEPDYTIFYDSGDTQLTMSDCRRARKVRAAILEAGSRSA